MKKKKNPHLGSTFDDFLKEEGLFEEVTANAMKRVDAWHRARVAKKRKAKSTVIKRKHPFD